MRILHVIPSLAARDGGPAKVVVEMCREITRRGAEAEIYTTNLDGRGVLDVPLGKPVVQGGVQVTYFPVGLSNFYKISWPLTVVLKATVPRYDAVHIHSLYQFPSTVAAYYCRRYGVPYIVRPHGTLDPFLFRRHRARKWLYEVAFERRNLRQAAAVQFTSEEESILAATHGLRLRPAVAPLGVDLDYSPLRISRGALGERWPETIGKRVLLYLGRINFKKGLDLLAQSFGRLARERADVHLLIAGPDSDGYAAKVRLLLSDQGVLDRTTFTGMVEGDAKAAALAESTMFVLPSYTENFGIAVVEAMAAGLPVVISNRVNIWREIDAAHAGLVVNTDAGEVADAMRALLATPERAAKMGRNGKNLAREQFSWESAGTRLMELYAGVISTNASGRHAIAQRDRVVADSLDGGAQP